MMAFLSKEDLHIGVIIFMDDTVLLSVKLLQLPRRSGKHRLLVCALQLGIKGPMMGDGIGLWPFMFPELHPVDCSLRPSTAP